MAEPRIAARLVNPDLLACVKAAAATYHARMVHWTGSMERDASLRDSTLVVLEAGGHSVLREFEAAKQACPEAEIIVFAGADTTPADMRRLFRAGARDVLSSPITRDQVMAALGEAIGPGVNGDAHGFVLGVVKAAGGVGATTLAVNIAGYFANPPQGKRGEHAEPMRVAVLDFDVQRGDAALAMDIVPRKDLTEILRTPKRLDTHFLDGLMERHRSGVALLGAPSSAIPLEAIESEVALSIVNTAAASFDLVVLELPSAWTEWTGTLLRRADRLLLVSTAAVRGVAGARRVLDAASQLNVEPARWSLAFNRLGSILDDADLIDQARRTLGPGVIGSMPEDAVVRSASDRGRLIWDTAPNARFAKEMRLLCADLLRMIEMKQRPAAQRQLAR